MDCLRPLYTRPEPDATVPAKILYYVPMTRSGKRERDSLYFYSQTDDRSILLPMLSFAPQKRRNLFPLCRRSTRRLCLSIWLYVVETAIAEMFQEITHFFFHIAGIIISFFLIKNCADIYKTENSRDEIISDAFNLLSFRFDNEGRIIEHSLLLFYIIISATLIGKKIACKKFIFTTKRNKI